MPSTARVEFVYLDTEAYDAASYDFAGTRFQALTKHLASGRLKLITTDITKAEVRGRILENVNKELASLKKLERGSRVLRSASRLGRARLFPNLDATTLAKRLHDAFDAFLRTHCSICIDATKQNASPVFARYFSQKPPFGPGAKRREFPDAFVLESLIGWTASKGTDAFVVSADKLLAAACEHSKTLHSVTTIPLLLDHVASDDAALASFLRNELKKHLDLIEKKAATDFQDLDFHVDDEWGDVELEVANVKLYGEPDLVDISGSRLTAEVQLTAHYEAHLSYEDSNSGIYDKEEGRRLFVNFLNETVESQELLVVTVRATFTGYRPQKVQDSEHRAYRPNKGIRYITLRKHWILVVLRTLG